MRIRALLATGFAVAGLLVGTAPSASAYCDPDYRPLCLNDCMLQPPPTDPEKLDDWLFRACPR